MIKRKYLILLATIGFLVAADQLSKLLIVTSLQLGHTINLVPGFFNFTLVHNPGAAFGFLATVSPSWREPFFLIVPAGTLLLIFLYFLRLKEWQSFSIYSLSLIMGGAIGNLVDRLRLGYVIDFLDFHWRFQIHFPAFNVADSAITVGVGLIIVGIFFEKEPVMETSLP